MLITMFTDAGFEPKLGAATWAVWAKESGKTLRYSGTIEGIVADNNVAEAMAIVNGLWCVNRVIKPPLGTKIIAQTDSLVAIDILTDKSYTRGRKRLQVATIREKFNEFINVFRFMIDLRHVEAHKGDNTPRNAVNTWCDRECSSLLEKKVAQLLQERSGKSNVVKLVEARQGKLAV
jgi:ribonuclease HI